MKIAPVLTPKQQYNTNRYFSFKGFPCAEDNFEIKNLYNIPCPACNISMIHSSEIEEFKKEIKDKTGDELIKLLEKYKKYYHPLEAKVVENIIKDAREESWVSIDEIISKEYNNSIQSRRKLQNSLYSIIENIQSSRFISDYKIKAFYNKTILIAKFHEEFNKEEFAKFLQQSAQQDEKTLKRAMKILEKCPDDDIEYNNFLEKIHNLSQEDIACALLKNSLVTTEHIKAIKAGGENNSANYLAQCLQCNNTRGSEDFKDWARSIPDFKKNIADYFKAVYAGIKIAGFSDKYDSYLTDAAKTIETETQGEIIPEIPIDINEAEDKKIVSDFIKQLNTTKRKLNNEISQMLITKADLESDEQYKDVILYCTLYNEIQEKEDRKREINSEYKNIHKQISQYSQKQMELSELKAKAAAIKPAYTSKVTISKEKRKIAQAQSDLNKTDITSLREKERELKKELSSIQAQRDTLKAKLDSIKIDKPEELQKEIQELQSKLNEFEENKKEIAQLKNSISSKENIIKKIKENEKALADLIALNQQLDASSGNFSEITKHEELSELLARAQYIEKNYKKNKKYNKKDDEVFVWVKQKIKDEMDMLAKANPCILYKLNLDKISKITYDLRKLNSNLSKIKETENIIKELDKKRLKLPYQSSAEIKSLINEKEDKLKMANMRFSVSNIDSEIQCKQELIAKINEALPKLYRKNISKKDFANIRASFE